MDPSTGEPFHCPVEGCGSKFKRKEHLVRHSKSHSSSRPFTCETCGKSFARSDVLRRHVRQHEDKDLNPPAHPQNACDLCHARKSRCDGSTPCGACVHRGLPCTRNRVVSRHRLTKALQDQTSESSTEEQERLSQNGYLETAPPIQTPTVPPLSDQQTYGTSPSVTRNGDQTSYTVLQSIFSPETLHNALHSFDHSQSAGAMVPTTSTTMIRPSPLSEVQATPQRWCPITGMSSDEVANAQTSYEDPSSTTIGREVPTSQSILPPSEPAAIIQQTSDARTDSTPPTTAANDEQPSFFQSEIVTAHSAAYFANFHSQWPILHPPSYDVLGWGPELIWSIIMLGARFTYTEDGKALSEGIHEEMMDIFEPSTSGNGNHAGGREARESLQHSERWNALVTLQASILNVIFAIYFGNEQHLTRARRLLRWLLKTVRDLGAFDRNRVANFAQSEQNEWEQNLKREGWMRLAYTCHDVEQFLSRHTDKELGESMERKLSFRRTWKGAENWETLSGSQWQRGKDG